MAFGLAEGKEISLPVNKGKPYYYTEISLIVKGKFPFPRLLQENMINFFQREAMVCGDKREGESMGACLREWLWWGWSFEWMPGAFARH